MIMNFNFKNLFHLKLINYNNNKKWFTTNIKLNNNNNNNNNNLIKRNIKYISKSGKVYYPTIGLEIHTQLNTKRKLFSRSINSFDNIPNNNVSNFDASIPGILPILNMECIEKAIKLILGVKGKVQEISKFDRKHYFYPDLPLGYQITQKYQPIGIGGEIVLNENEGLDYSIKIRIEQIQLEQDTGNLLKEINSNLKINLNRAGSPLLEIITKPDFKNSIEPIKFLQKFQLLLRKLNISDGNMEEGSLRCDVNVSVSEDVNSFGIRCELKNLNTFKIISSAIDYEIKRQVELIESGLKVKQETRGYDIIKKETFRLREKENISDYRYMPEPDLPPLKINLKEIKKIQLNLPELPDNIILRFKNEYNLRQSEIITLINEPNASEFFDKAMKLNLKLNLNLNSQFIANFITSILFGILMKENQNFKNLKLTPLQLISILKNIQENIISSKIGKFLLIKMVKGDSRLADEIIKLENLAMINDEVILLPLVQNLVQNNLDKAKKVKLGDQRQAAWFLGKVMSLTNGKASPVIVHKLLDKLT